MKKIILFILGMLLIVGCDNIDNTPKMKVEELLNSYKDLTDEVLTDLDTKLLEANVDEEVRGEMKDVYKRQYKDMEYEIKSENINNDEAIVEVELTVYDYGKAREEAEAYIDEHSEEFMTGNIIDDIKTQRYIIERQNETTKRTKQGITLELTKDNGKWTINDLDDETIEKIHGTYIDNKENIEISNDGNKQDTNETENNNENLDQ